jgi:hypothetical protein
MLSIMIGNSTASRRLKRVKDLMQMIKVINAIF